MARFQNGWLQKKPRKSGDIWVFCYRRQRPEDGQWVQATPIKVGKVKDYPSEERAWRRVEELHLNPNQSPFELCGNPHGPPVVDPPFRVQRCREQQPNARRQAIQEVGILD